MPVTAVRDEGALRMWVCRLPAHIGPLGSCKFAEEYRKNGAFCRADVGIGPYSGNGSRLLPQILRALAEKVKFFSNCTKHAVSAHEYASFFDVNEYL